jgi:nucleoside-diphosphate-sugar epimerase
VKALVTGATGFIGSHLVELLLQKKYAVRCLLRTTSSTKWLKNLPVEYAYGDLFDDAALDAAVEGVDVVYHSAGLTKARTKEEYYRGNVIGTRNLLAAVRRRSQGLRRFVYISSQAAAGPSPDPTPITEDVQPHPITTYGRTKRQGEEECLALMPSLPATIVRPPVVYGPRDKDVFEFFHTVYRGLQPIVGFGEKFVSLVHVLDLIRGIVLAAESPRALGETYFISSTRTYGWKEIGDVTKRILQKRVLRIRIPETGVFVVAGLAELGARVSRKAALINLEKARDMVQDYWTCDSSKARRDFGYEQQISLEEGVQGTIRWYQEEGWLG